MKHSTIASKEVRPSSKVIFRGAEHYLLGNVGACDSHGNADVCLLKSRGVVHSIAGDRDDGSQTLERFHNLQLLLRRGPSEDNLRVGHQQVVELRVRHVFEDFSMDDCHLKFFDLYYLGFRGTKLSIFLWM